ncbi:MAG TPA: hypothetical protein VNL14_15100 [Candidatus Acidoferrales bacterium]|nr:hypothetical protein [Candidatus Acidoferrales bacterium]
MKGTIQIKSSGRGARPYVEAVMGLRGKIESAGVRIEDIRAYEAWDAVILTIIGAVGAELIKEILNVLFAKTPHPPPENIKITIIDQSTNITFNLPQDVSKANEYFDRKESTET